MDAVPAATPPPGVTANLVDPPSDGNILIIVGTILMSVMFVIAGLRFYTRICIRRKMSADDWTTLIAIIGTLVYYILCILAVPVAKYGTHVWNLSAAHLMSSQFIIISFFINWVTSIVWPFAKTTFLLMYLDLFKPFRWQRYAIYFGLLVNWGFYIAIAVATLYYTSPAPGQSWQESFLSPRYTGMVPLMIPIAVGNLVLDVYILILPMLSIWRLQMGRKKKFGVAAIFATGFVACIASSLSIYFKVILRHHEEDFTYYTLPVLIMCLAEMCVGITASCMPSMSLLIRRRGGFLGTMVSSLLNFVRKHDSRNATERSSGSGSGSGSFGKLWFPAIRAPRHSYTTMDEDLELCQTRVMKTSIRSENWQPRPDASGIRMSYGLTQDVVVPPAGRGT
ncbi:hypothetical protein ASPACDRAFT_1857760 [Aspergillus aculeatus ATCC 16872]|uniref:Rhodopsin domain-containing protein n=1 Tax=Aspergillus aculeatus (strain ATCC 16872 / CBS 172.66 / WB 5094) TaxID=690307 RepID=A0A1L9WQR3_ASPA1|nr:uncharacterized protein ASPACDRAFT_1857760 [Aspergillus aculeatus ATCC 16872]OJJ98505.1 hypothetical protein ASPACDRAFT_1857760 [Aspergillus aculeatus ATCC 16872]